MSLAVGSMNNYGGSVMDELDAPVLYYHDETMPPIEPGTFGFGLSRRSFLAGGASALMATILAGCGGKSSDSGGATTTLPGGPVTTANAIPVAGDASSTSTTGAARTEAKTETITVGVSSLQEAYVDPNWAVGGLIFPLQWAIADFLYFPDKDGKFQPTLATGYTLSDDKLKWTFKLRPNVKMHDGSTFGAKDVKTTIDRIVSGPNAKDYAHYVAVKGAIIAANVIDDLTVEIVTSKPFATCVVDMPPPIASDYYNQVGEVEFKKNPKSTGPWKFVSQELNANVKYDRHEEFWDASRKPNWKKLVYAIVPDESARVAGIKTGTLDLAYGLTGSGAEGLKGDANVKVVEIKETGLGYCMMLDNVFPNEPSPLQDVRVRRALLMAVDREAIAKALYKGYATVPQSGTPKITPGFNPDNKAVPFDPEGAKKLLAEAGVTNLEIQLGSYTTTTVPDMPKLAETIAQYWQQVGVKATLNNMETATYLPSWRNKQLKGAGMIAGPTYFYVEPSRLSVNSFFGSTAVYSTIVGNAELDAVIEKITVETDFDKRAALGRQQADLIDKNLWGLPMILTSSLIAVGPNVQTFGYIVSCPYAGPTTMIVAK
ncbi:MAG: ABC transporter substrate-binding protein [Acidimicrobiales bacterium]